jgi:paraquat-inducible protein B
MTEVPKPRLTRRVSLPLIWVVPLVALLVGGWMIYREWRNRGPVIIIEFGDGGGIVPGRTLLHYKGVPVGRVRSVEFGDEFRHVLVHLQLERTAASLAREGAQFWVVQPQVGLFGVDGLDTLFSGARLAVRPGDGAPQSRFQGLDRPPPSANVDAGRAFILESERLSGVSTGTEVTFRDIRVGTVEDCRLASDARKVLIRIRVNSPYDDLVRPNTRFWSTGGLSLRIGLRGAELNAGSLTSLFSGGIAFATPESDANLPPAGEGTRFELHGELDKDWLKWSPALRIDVPPITPIREIGTK